MDKDRIMCSFGKLLCCFGKIAHEKFTEGKSRASGEKKLDVTLVDGSGSGNKKNEIMLNSIRHGQQVVRDPSIEAARNLLKDKNCPTAEYGTRALEQVGERSPKDGFVRKPSPTNVVADNLEDNKCIDDHFQESDESEQERLFTIKLESKQRWSARKRGSNRKINKERYKRLGRKHWRLNVGDSNSESGDFLEEMESMKEVNRIFEEIRVQHEAAAGRLQKAVASFYNEDNTPISSCLLVAKSVFVQLTKVTEMFRVVLDKQYNVIASDFGKMCDWFFKFDFYLKDLMHVVAHRVLLPAIATSNDYNFIKRAYSCMHERRKIARALLNVLMVITYLQKELGEDEELTLSVAKRIALLWSACESLHGEVTEWVRAACGICSLVLSDDKCKIKESLHQLFLKRIVRGEHKRFILPMFMESLESGKHKQSIFLRGLFSRFSCVRYRGWLSKYENCENFEIPKYNLPTWA